MPFDQQPFFGYTATLVVSSFSAFPSTISILKKEDSYTENQADLMGNKNLVGILNYSKPNNRSKGTNLSFLYLTIFLSSWAMSTVDVMITVAFPNNQYQWQHIKYTIKYENKILRLLSFLDCESISLQNLSNCDNSRNSWVK